MSIEWREVELNARPVVVFANRCATYSTPHSIEIRFLHQLGMQKSRIANCEDNILELQNGAHVSLPPSVALQLIADLQRSVNDYERLMGKIVTEEEIFKRRADAGAA